MCERVRYFICGVLLAGSASAVQAEGPMNTGTYSISGSVSYSNNEQASFSQSTGNITLKEKSIRLFPGFMYFVQPELAIGASLQYAKTSGDVTGLDTIGLGPVVRYYFLTEDMYPFIEGEYIYSQSKTDDGFESNVRTATVGLGMDYFLARNVAIEPMLTYSDSSFHLTGGGTSADLDASGIVFRIGINVFVY
ncbi:MAG: outer membrane beta-barrel protein [Gammaproteobacteria bacterium]|nr:outer membrane beta-barrel protein [Gammaproteobacteria bacterium]